MIIPHSASPPSSGRVASRRRPFYGGDIGVGAELAVHRSLSSRRVHVCVHTLVPTRCRRRVVALLQADQKGSPDLH